MDSKILLRKAVHMCAPLFALLYLTPEDLGLFSRDVLAIILWTIFAMFEIIRIRMKLQIPGLREYEYTRPSAAFWMCSAFLPMILFFPVDYALPLLIGFGFTDPMIGLLRKNRSKLYPIVPLLFYFSIMLISFSISFDLSVKIMLLACIVTIAAIWAESLRNKLIDDDFLMLFVPLVVLWLFGTVLI